MKIYYVDGQYVPADKAMIPVDDLSVLRGYGVCDIMRTYKGNPYFLNEHIHRLEHSAKEIGLSISWSKEDMIHIVLETLKKNQLENEVNIRIVITGGSSPDFFYPHGKPRLIVLVTDMKELPESWYENGVKVITHLSERTIPDAKVTSYIPAAMALKKAKQHDAIEAIYVNSKMEVLEGTTSNLFAFFNDTLATPKEGVLNGITRQAVLSLAKDIFKIQERAITLEQLLSADEVFITGTNKCIVPVIKVDEAAIGNGKPGENTKHLMEELERHSLNFIQSLDE